MSSAERVRAFRNRMRRKRTLVQIEIATALPLALAEAGFLAEWDTENEQAIGTAIEQVLDAMCARYECECNAVTGSEGDAC